MEKPAAEEPLIHELIRTRWSPRAFSDQPVEPEKLASLLAAARWAASCYNEQPWRFIVATKAQPAAYQQLLGCLVEFNARWASHAPVLMISVAKLNFSHNQQPNRHAIHDVGQAAAQLSLQATALGLAVHQMAGFDAEKTRAEFQIPPDYQPVAAIAIGYPGDPMSLPEELREKELAARTRQPLESFVFSITWGEASPLVK